MALCRSSDFSRYHSPLAPSWPATQNALVFRAKAACHAVPSVASSSAQKSLLGDAHLAPSLPCFSSLLRCRQPGLASAQSKTHLSIALDLLLTLLRFLPSTFPHLLFHILSGVCMYSFPPTRIQLCKGGRLAIPFLALFTLPGRVPGIGIPGKLSGGVRRERTPVLCVVLFELHVGCH